MQLLQLPRGGVDLATAAAQQQQAAREYGAAGYPPNDAGCPPREEEPQPEYAGLPTTGYGAPAATAAADPPYGGAVPEPEPEPEAQSGPSEGLPQGWQSAVDPASGETYYVDDAGDSHWELPGAATPEEAGAEQPAGALPPGWEAAIDPSSGREYYANPDTGETLWEFPQASVDTAANPFGVEGGGAVGGEI